MRIILALVLVLLPLSLQAALPVQEVKSRSGITAWLQEDSTLPVISLAFAWKGGFENDPEDKQGLSTLATTMLTQGAGEYDATAFQKELRQTGMSINFEARRDFIRGSVRSLKETLPMAVKLLRASVTAPRFDEAELALQKNKQAAGLKFHLSDPSWLASRLAMREYFMGHPYSRRALGNEASIDALTSADMKSWMKHLARENLIVTATGAITAKELSKLLDDAFGALPEKAPEVKIEEAKPKGSGETYLIPIPGPQVDMMMVWPGLKRADRDWYVLEVMNYILGGGSFSSRLMKEIREKRGLTYGISSGPAPLEHAALYMIEASFEGKNAAEVMRLVQEELNKLSSTSVSDEELKAAKDYLVGSYPLVLTSSSSIASYLLGLRANHLSKDEEERHAKAVRSVSAGDIQDLAKKLFSKPPVVFMAGAPLGVIPTQTVEKVD
jgi:zinc protease